MTDPGRASGSDTCNFFPKPPRNCNIRKRKFTASSSDEEDAAPSIPKPKKPTASDNKLHSSSARPSVPDAPDVAASNPDPTLFRYASSTEIQVNHDSRATATLETEYDFSNDARAIRERFLKRVEEAFKGKPKPGGDGAASSKVYKGINSYTDYKAGFRREQTVAGEKASDAHGPLCAAGYLQGL